jgi:pilus assembly protein CpaF
MFAIIIQEKGGEQRRLMFDKPEVTIGRVQGNDIVLPKGNVSKRHARIVLKDGKFIIVDLKSTNGTYVNGRKITSPLVVKDSDKIYIGDFIMGVDESSASGADAALPEPAPATTAPPPRLEPSAPPPPRFEPGFGDRPRPAEPAAPPPLDRPRPAEPTAPPHAQNASPELLRAALSRQDAPRPAPLGDPAPTPEPPRPAAARGLDAPPAIPPRPAAPLPRPDSGASPREPRAPEPLAAPIPAPAPAAAPIPAPSPRRPGGTLPPPSGGSPTAPPPMGAVSAASASAATAAAPAQVPIPAPPPMAAPAPSIALADRGRPPANDAAGPPTGWTSPTPRTEQVERLPRRAPRRLVTRPVPPLAKRGIRLEPLDEKLQKLLDLQTQILDRLRAKLDLDNIAVERLGDEDLWQKAERAIVDLVETLESSGELPKTVEQDTLIKETLNEALGLGPLEDLLADTTIDEIIVDRKDRLVVGKDGALRGSGKAFSSDDVLRRVVERLVAPTGLTIDEQNPVIDVRLRDGSRLTAAVPPVATQGACLVLRKPRGTQASLGDLVSSGALSREMKDFLATCVAARRNVLVCGGADAGKTRLLSALVGAATPGERTVTVEEVAELSLGHDEWIGLETRAADGRTPAVDLGQLVHTALRLRPDRLVIGDVRGGEAFALTSALGSAIDGAVVGVSGEGGPVALGHLAVLARLGAPGVDDEVVRDVVAAAIDVVIHVGRFADGTTRVVSIDEVVGATDTGFETQALFTYRGPGDGGGFGATGAIPRFWTELEGRGLPAELGIFKT